MVGVFPILYIGYKLFHRTSIKKSDEVDLFQDLDEIEEYQREYVEKPPK